MKKNYYVLVMLLISQTIFFGQEDLKKSNFITTQPPTTDFDNQIYTGDDKNLSDLTITGTNIQWYTNATGGTVLPNTTLLIDDTTYYASQTIGSVESAERLAITVNRISDDTQAYNTGDTVGDLSSSPITGATVQWFASANDVTALSNSELLSDGIYYVEQRILPVTETLGSGFNGPFRLAVYDDGKILVADAFNNIIKRMDADGSNIETLGIGFNRPEGVLLETPSSQYSRILLADSNNNTIRRMEYDGTNIETLGSGFSGPRNIALDALGRILVADTFNNVIKRMDADGTNIQIVGSGFDGPYDVEVQADGKILIADTDNGVVKRMDADGTNIEILGTGFNVPVDIEVQEDGKILVADFGLDEIVRMDSDGTNLEVLNIIDGVNSNSVAVDPNGKIIFNEYNNVKRLLEEAKNSNRVPVVVSNTLNINDFDIDKSLQVYPNPTSNKIFIQIDEGLTLNNITVFNSIGQRVLISNNINNELDISKLSDGLLFLKIDTNIGTVVKRIIKH